MIIVSGIDVKNSIFPFIGKSVNRVWQGNGSTIFLEIGELTEDNGELTIIIEGRWRVEGLKDVLFWHFPMYSEFS